MFHIFNSFTIDFEKSKKYNVGVTRNKSNKKNVKSFSLS